ncbi:MAG: hypothetical protein L0Y72_07685 [Gemmataceae bacterium]|nr:hypothetical protein [Gemmataceae bacterium]MCI0738910.1 hypothetical protein [Gemmataceae bacterium]
MPHIQTAVVTLSMLILHYSSTFADAQDARLKTIVERWTAKESETRFASFQWTDRSRVPKATDLKLEAVRELIEKRRKIDPEGARALEATLAKNSEDRLSEQSITLKLNGNDWRLDYYDVTAAKKECVETIVSKGGLRKILIPDSNSFATGLVEQTQVSAAPQLEFLRALFICYRPTAFKVIDLSKYELDSQPQKLNDTDCLVLKAKKDSGSATTFYLDPGMEFAVVRWTEGSNGQITTKGDIDYFHDKTYGWIPKEWRRVNMHDGKMNTSVSSRIDSWEIGRDNSLEFDLQFPANSLIHDRTITREKKVSYILRPDGTKRLITKEESTATYEELKNSESGQAKKRGYHSISPFYAVLVAVVVAAGLILLVRWLRTKRLF